MKDYFDDLNKTERGRTVIRLIKYMTFLFFFLLLMLSSSLSTPKNSKVYSNDTVEVQPEKKSISYMEKQKKLLDANYSYEFKVSGPFTILYSGKYENGIFDGIKETDDEIVKYVHDGDKYYKKTMNSKEEYPDLYIGIDEKYFNLNYIFELINKRSTIIERNDKTKKYTYENVDGANFIVTTDESKILGIEIKTDLLTYDLSFNI